MYFSSTYRYGLWLVGEGAGRRYIGWMRWINLDVVGLMYVRAREVRMWWVGYHRRPSF
jgi:hypothetical protein